MSHHHEDHHHHHSHSTSSEAPPSEKEKLVKMVEHWIHHNEDHARSYRDWAQKARSLGQSEVYTILEEVASGTELQNANFEKILSILKG